MFSSASLIHSDRDHLKEVLARLFDALASGGLVYLSLKQADAYTEITKQDQFGTRTYYHYSMDDIRELAHQYVFVKAEQT